MTKTVIITAPTVFPPEWLASNYRQDVKQQLMTLPLTTALYLLTFGL